MFRISHRVMLASLLLVALACKAKEEKAAAVDTTTVAARPEPTRSKSLSGFSTPESVIWDQAQSKWFVSNIDGSPTAKDGNGFISRLSPDGDIDSLKFIAGGRDKVTLNAPKGMAITGDTLWVTDIDAVRGFNRLTGKPVATINLGKKVKFLNDLVAAPDGSLYVTDTGVEANASGMSHPGPDQVFHIGADHKVEMLATGEAFAAPNGLAWDGPNNRLIVVPFGGTNILAIKGDSAPTVIGKGPGQQDGVVILPDGRILVSSWTDSTVFVAEPERSEAIIRGVPSPADIGYRELGSVLAIPLFTENRVEFWTVPSR